MRNSSATRDRIERAALELFVGQGVRETTIRDIAAKAGVAEGALYRHHAGKDDLVRALFVTHYETLAEQLQAVADTTVGIDGRLTAMVDTFCRLHDHDPILFAFLLLVQHGQLDRIGPDRPSPVAAVRAVVAEAMAAGEIPSRDIDVVTAMVMGIVLQTATFKAYGRIAAPMGELVPYLAAACRAVVRMP
ncbi:MAG: TetR/AcrR family transcriptional regulator [Magnetospirillum sp.]|nr:TetR/AcrR family transcriptional regulator [Magnetospirillum sp.]